jgi:alanyl-tRNA synthetase
MATGEDSRGPWVLLEDTVFYPEGGGQPADRGTVGGVPVVDVQKTPEGIKHYLAGTPPSGRVLLQLDWPRRFDHMQQHTGQHILSAVAEDRFGWKTTAFHLGTERCDVELAVAHLSSHQLSTLEEAVAEQIRAAKAVKVHWVPAEAFPQMKGVRTRGLPEGHQGPVRLVEIQGLDLNTCGGTHVANTAQVEALVLLGTEPMRGGTRVYFLAGTRVRRRLHQQEERQAALRALLNASDGDLVQVAQEKLNQLSQLARQLRQAQESWSSLLGQELALQEGPLLSWHQEEPDPTFLQRVAKAFLLASEPNQDPGKVLVLTGGRLAGVFVVASHRSDLQELGKAMASLLQGRGGGAGSLFQGKCQDLSQREGALAHLARLLQESSRRPGENQEK